MKTWRVIDLITWTTGYLQGQGISSARLDAELLLGHVLGKARLELYVHFQDAVPTDKLAAYRELIKRRAQRIPLAYLTHEREFMGLPFYVDTHVLIPRPETETLVEILESRQQGDAHILEIGTGCGAIAVSLAKRKGWSVVATDISSEALEVARRNAESHKVADRIHFLQGDLFAPIEQTAQYDWVVSNPPYIPTDVLPTLEPELSHEPSIALDGGPDGLDMTRLMIAGAPAHLKPGGWLILEIGHDQAGEIGSLIEANPAYATHMPLRDYSRVERFILAQHALV